MTNVSTQAELAAAIAARETDIVVTASFDIDQTITIPYRHTVSSDGNGPYTLTKRQGFNLSVFDIINRGELILRNIVLDGAKETHTQVPDSQSLVTVGAGSLLLDTGSVLQNNYAFAGGGVSISADGAVSNLSCKATPSYAIIPPQTEAAGSIVITI